MSEHKSQIDKLERLEAFEDRLGVRLDALYAKIDESQIYRLHGREFPGICVTGEVHAACGTTLPLRIKIIVDAYDAHGRLVCTNGTGCFYPETFYGYESFEVGVGGTHPGLIKKLRVYPKSTLY